MGVALGEVGWYSARLGEYEKADEHCKAALTLHRGPGHQPGEAATLDSLAYIAHHTGRHIRAIEHHCQAIALFRELGDTYEVATTLDNLGYPHAALGQYSQACAVWREALEIYRVQQRDDKAQRVQEQLDHLNAGLPGSAA